MCARAAAQARLHSDSCAAIHINLIFASYGRAAGQLVFATPKVETFCMPCTGYSSITPAFALAPSTLIKRLRHLSAMVLAHVINCAALRHDNAVTDADISCGCPIDG